MGVAVGQIGHEEIGRPLFIDPRRRPAANPLPASVPSAVSQSLPLRAATAHGLRVFFPPVTSNTAFIFILVFPFSFFAHEHRSTDISFYQPVGKNMLTVATAVAATTITSALETAAAAATAVVAVEITSL